MSKNKPFTTPFFTYGRDISSAPHIVVIYMSDEPNYESDPLHAEHARISDLLSACGAKRLDGIYNGWIIQDDEFTRLKRAINNKSIVDREYGPKRYPHDPIPVIRPATWRPTFRMEMERAARERFWNTHAIDRDRIMATKDPDIVNVGIRHDAKLDGLHSLFKKINNDIELDWRIIEYPDWNSVLWRTKVMPRLTITVKRNWSGYVKVQAQSDLAAG